MICGKQGGSPFQTVQRPDVNGNCPASYSPCVPTANAENMVCYPESSLETSCPITDLLFVETSALADYADYSSLEFNSTTTLIWSKSKDALPVTTIRLDSAQPCINPWDQTKAAS